MESESVHPPSVYNTHTKDQNRTAYARGGGYWDLGTGMLGSRNQVTGSRETELTAGSARLRIPGRGCGIVNARIRIGLDPLTNRTGSDGWRRAARATLRRHARIRPAAPRLELRVAGADGDRP